MRYHHFHELEAAPINIVQNYSLIGMPQHFGYPILLRNRNTTCVGYANLTESNAFQIRFRSNQSIFLPSRWATTKRNEISNKRSTLEITKLLANEKHKLVLKRVLYKLPSE